MSRGLSFFVRGWALGLTAYALVFTREVPVALAQAPIETDCSADLDQPDTTYLLSTNVAGDCVIAADNIILDGQNLYEIAGSVRSNTNASFVIQNAPSVASVYAYYPGNVTIQSSTIDSYAYTSDGDLTINDSTVGGAVSSVHGGAVSITNSAVTGNVSGYSGLSLVNTSTGNVRTDVGDMSLTGGSAVGDIHAYGGYTITISESEVDGSINANAHVVVTDSVLNDFIDLNGYDITVTDSSVASMGAYSGTITVNNSDVYGHISAGGTGSIDVGDSFVNGYIYSGQSITLTNSTVDAVEDSYSGRSVSSDACTITDSTLTPARVFCEAPLTLVDNPPSLTVSPPDLSLDYGEDFNPFSGVSADDIKDGDLSSEVIVIGEVGQEDGVHQLFYSVTDSGTTLEKCNQELYCSDVTSGPSTASTTRTVTRGDKPSQSTSVGTRDARKEKEIIEAPLFVPGDINTTLDTLKEVLAQPLTTNDPAQLKKLLNLLLQLVVALTQLSATGGKQ